MSWPQHLVAIVPCNDLNVRAPTPDPRLQLTGRSEPDSVWAAFLEGAKERRLVWALA
jgi:hypothetical protein